METRHLLGRTAEGAAFYVEIERSYTRSPQVSITHDEVPSGATTVSFSGATYDSFGQNFNTARGVQPQAPFTHADVARLCDIWERWHLNHMRAGCAHQSPVGATADERLDQTPPCPDTGYRWGSAWLYEAVPQDVLDDVARFQSMPTDDTEPAEPDEADDDGDDDASTTYHVTRFFQSDDVDNEVIATGLSFEEAHSHCNSPESSSRTATSLEAVTRTQKYGAWFDGKDED